MSLRVFRFVPKKQNRREMVGYASLTHPTFFFLSLCIILAVGCGNGESDRAPADVPVDPDDSGTPVPSRPILAVEVEDHITYRLMNGLFPQWTGDLWAGAWGDDGRLYVANGDGFGFGLIFADIVFNIVDGFPPCMTGYTPPRAIHAFVACKWGPRSWEVSRKPTGMVCVDGDLYLFFQNLKNQFTETPFGDAPHASISVSRDHGATWEYDPSEPMFTDHVFTTGFFLDFGQCQEHAIDHYVYVYGLDYNWRYSPGFSQTRMFLARVPNTSILDRKAWEFFTGLDPRCRPTWSPEIDDRVPVLEDDTLYHGKKSGIAQGSVVYIPGLNRYLYSTRARYEWIFYEAPMPWGPWTKITVQEWLGGWTEEFHAGYPAMIYSKFLDSDGLGGWIITSLSSSYFDGMYYNMGFRRFTLEAGEADSVN